MFNISKVEKDDIHEVKKLLSNVWADTYKSILSEQAINKVTTIWHNPKLLEAQCESKNTLFAIAKEHTQRIIGLATGNLIDDKTLNLSRLYIAKEYQRVGIGSLLLNYVMDEFPLIEKIQLEVAVGNQKGISFYTKNGFVAVTSKDEEIENEHMELIVMEKYI